jgi:hypothetical protein
MVNTTEQPQDKREKIKLLREFHQDTFDALQIPNAFFLPKLAHTPKGKTERMIAFFASEVAKGQDIYIEFADSDGDPQDPERRLYKWRYIPSFRDEYEKVEHENGSTRYFVPTSELILIKNNAPETVIEENANKTPQLKLDLPVNTEDINLSNASIRDFAAIMWKKPVSNKPWLNDLIRKAE